MPWSIFREGGGDGNAVAWAKQLLTMIGAPVTPGNTEFIYQWEKAEGGGGKYNPLNQGPVPGHPELTTTGQQYGGGAADFASWQAGLQGAVDYLNMPYYTKVLSNLKSNNPVAARAALWQSPWASSHYGYGKNWPNVALPGNAKPTLDFSTAGAADAVTGTNASANSAPDPTCAIGFNTSGVKIPLGIWNPTIGSGSLCFISKSGARALLGGIVLGAGLITTGVGLAFLLKYGYNSTALYSAVAPIRKGGSIEGNAQTRFRARRETTE